MQYISLCWGFDSLTVMWQCVSAASSKTYELTQQKAESVLPALKLEWRQKKIPVEL